MAGGSDLDMADLDPAAAAAAAATTSSLSTHFRPKLKGKPKAERPDPKPEPKPEPGPKLESEPEPLAVAAAPLANAPVATDGGKEADDVGRGMEGAAGVEEEEEEEDFVVREIDVYFTPDRLDEDTLLYVMQYPLRPSWRPYEYEETYEEVRVKPKHSKVEVDLSIKRESKEFDSEVAGLHKQTLYSLKPSYVSDYAIGVLRGDIVHLNHVDAVVQLRPSMSHVNVDQHNKTQTLQDGEMDDGADGPTNSSIKGKMDSEDSNENIEDSEPWISLEYDAVDNNSSKYLNKMTSNEGGPINFTMKASDYVVSLCPGTDRKKTRGILRMRELQQLPLEQRLKKWLTEDSEVNRFDALMYLAPTHSEEEMLKVLQDYADLVQGLWVCKSSLLFDDMIAYKRDFILLQFTKKDSIHQRELEKLGLNPDARLRIMAPLSVERKVLKDWKFREFRDTSFIKRYPDIVREQECAWSTREKIIMDSLTNINKSDPRKSKNLSRLNVSSNTVGPNVNNNRDGAVGLAVEEDENNRRYVLKMIFKDHKVRSLPSVVRDLRKLATSLASNRRERPRLQALSNAATVCAETALDKLGPIISTSGVAIPVHDVFVLKSEVKNTLRNVLIKLFRDKEPKAKLTKQEIMEAGLRFLKREISDSEYNQATDEVCIRTDDGHLALKSGEEP